MQKIPLTRDQFAIIDDADFAKVSKHKWHAVKRWNIGYDATTSVNGKMVRMSSVVIESKRRSGYVIDHINHDSLDNRKVNLRVCTIAQNQMNRIPSLNTSSIYKGVYWRKRDKRWYSRISVKGKLKHLGSFVNEKDAAIKYNKAANQFFGEFAYLNKT